MKNLFLILFLFCANFNLSKAQNAQKQEIPETVIRMRFYDETGFNDLLFRENYGKPKAEWWEYHDFYVNFVKNKKWQSHQYFEKIKQSCYVMIVKECNLDKDTSPDARKKVLFYLEEMQKSTFVDPVLAIRLLDVSSFSQKQKQEYAKKAFEMSETEYKKDMLYFKENVSKMDNHSKNYFETYKNGIEKFMKLKE